MLKSFSRKNHSAADNILVLDFGRLGDALTNWNAELLGMNVTNNTDYLFEALPHKNKRLVVSMAQVCSTEDLHGNDYKTCRNIGNGFSLDGLHWCSESLNGRLNAGTACMMQCMYSFESDDFENMRGCEDDCNDRFMSLRPIDRFDDSAI
jgi:hypothetical protein